MLRSHRRQRPLTDNKEEPHRHMTLLHAFTRIVSEKTCRIYATAVAFTTCVPLVLRTYKLKVEQTVFRHEQNQ